MRRGEKRRNRKLWREASCWVTSWDINRNSWGTQVIARRHMGRFTRRCQSSQPFCFIQSSSSTLEFIKISQLLKQGFSASALQTFWDRQFFVWGAVLCFIGGVEASLGLCLLDVSGNFFQLPAVTLKMFPDIAKCPGVREDHPWFTTTVLSIILALRLLSYFTIFSLCPEKQFFFSSKSTGSSFYFYVETSCQKHCYWCSNYKKEHLWLNLRTY